MVEDRDRIFGYIQNNFSNEKTLLTIGSGVSAGEGISGMGKLAEHLLTSVQASLNKLPDVDKETLADWTTVTNALTNGAGLEEALTLTDTTETLENLIRRATCELIEPENRAIFTKVFLDGKKLSLVPLLTQLTLTNSYPLTIITTNYDCLVEYACMSIGANIDNLFYGSYFRRFDPASRAKRHQIIKPIGSGNKRIPTVETDYVLILKPHGSIDWFSKEGKTYLLPYPGPGIPEIITPGKGKWKKDRLEPFVSVYAACTRAIDAASGYLFLGYGYNDEDLQEHYGSVENRDKPKLIVTMESNSKIDELLESSSNCMLIVKKDDGAIVRWKLNNVLQTETVFPDPFWKIDYLVEKVFRES